METKINEIKIPRNIEICKVFSKEFHCIFTGGLAEMRDNVPTLYIAVGSKNSKTLVVITNGNPAIWTSFSSSILQYPVSADP